MKIARESMMDMKSSNMSMSISFLELLNKVPQPGCLKQQKFIVSQFWRLEVQYQGIGRVGFF